MDKQSIIILSAFALVLLGGIYWGISDTFSKIPVEISDQEQIPNELVCMVNDAFMGTAQIPVEADGKTYYGCCEMCVTKIQENVDNVRFAVDPLTGEKVDKAHAYIVFKPGQKKEVLYFSSERHYDAYLNKP